MADNDENAVLNARMAALRAELTRRRLDGFAIPRADAHLGEYVAADCERLAWLTGFTGSAGMAVVQPSASMWGGRLRRDRIICPRLQAAAISENVSPQIDVFF